MFVLMIREDERSADMLLQAGSPAAQQPSCGVGPVDLLRQLLGRPDNGLDYAHSALAVDRIASRSVNPATVLTGLDDLTRWAWRLAGRTPSVEAKLSALRTVVYESGAWNGFRPFTYDHENFRSNRLKLVSNYMESRRGNCVSMPILFLILADRLGIDIGLALAPFHLFLRYASDEAGEVNLEATSGALPARDLWIRQQRGISGRAVASGIFMRKLGRRESVAAMALTVVERLMASGRHEEALEAAEIIAKNSPRNVFALAHQGQACFHILRTKYLDKYGSALLIPPALRPRYASLLHRNRSAFAKAKALGWQPAPAPQE